MQLELNDICFFVKSLTFISSNNSHLTTQRLSKSLSIATSFTLPINYYYYYYYYYTPHPVLIYCEAFKLGLVLSHNIGHDSLA